MQARNRATLHTTMILFSFAFVSVAAAAPTGKTVYGHFGNFAPCAFTDDASVSISVDVPSTLLVSIAGSVKNPDTAQAYTVEFHPELMDASDTTTLATNQGIIEIDPAPTFQTFSDTEVLVESAASEPYTLAPGNYLLKLTFYIGGSCEGTGPFFKNSVLTYLLLSSVQDRIFASGFNAMNLKEPLVKAFLA